MGFTGTPAAEYIERELFARFDEQIIGIGQYSRRKIADTERWSEHSWGNALDLHVSVGRADVTEKANGDEIAAWLRDQKTELGIRNVLWWVKNHFDHIHTDFWPRGEGIPPLKTTGIGEFKGSNGEIVKAQIQVVPMEGPGLKEERMPLLPIKVGDTTEDVTLLEDLINTTYGTNLSLWPRLYDEHTVAAVKKYLGPSTEEPIGQNGELVNGRMFAELFAAHVRKVAGGEDTSDDPVQPLAD